MLANYTYIMKTDFSAILCCWVNAGKIFAEEIFGVFTEFDCDFQSSYSTGTLYHEI